MNLKLLTLSQSTKKQDENDKADYRPISLLPIISKILEKALYSQLETVANKTFSPKLCGFRKGHFLQNALLNLLQNWQQCLDTFAVAEIVLMHLSKAYDFLPHDLLIAKLATYGFL